MPTPSAKLKRNTQQLVKKVTTTVKKVLPTKKQPKHTVAFLKEMEQVLLSEKERLEIELGHFAKRTERNPDDFETTFSEFGDELDANAHEIEEYTVNKPLEVTLENAYRDIKKALETTKKGTYGTCKYCKNPIEEKRLRARPSSSSCVECKKAITDEV
jgi:DnaK suppressor protein